MTYCLQFTQKTLPVVFPKISMCSGGLPLGNQSRRNSKSRNQRWRLLSQEVGVRFTKQDGPSYSYAHTHNQRLSKPAPLGLPPPQSTRKCAHLPLYRGSLQNLNLKKCMHLGEKNKFFFNEYSSEKKISDECQQGKNFWWRRKLLPLPPNTKDNIYPTHILGSKWKIQFNHKNKVLGISFQLILTA